LCAPELGREFEGNDHHHGFRVGSDDDLSLDGFDFLDESDTAFSMLVQFRSLQF
jgi:hypothetical protein